MHTVTITEMTFKLVKRKRKKRASDETQKWDGWVNRRNVDSQMDDIHIHINIRKETERERE